MPLRHMYCLCGSHDMIITSLLKSNNHVDIVYILLYAKTSLHVVFYGVPDILCGRFQMSALYPIVGLKASPTSFFANREGRLATQSCSD